jgi:hypothetical protein
MAVPVCGAIETERLTIDNPVSRTGREIRIRSDAAIHDSNGYTRAGETRAPSGGRADRGGGVVEARLNFPVRSDAKDARLFRESGECRRGHGINGRVDCRQCADEYAAGADNNVVI